jgi:hypothetical protein
MIDRLRRAVADVLRFVGLEKAAAWIEAGGGPRPVK